MPPTPIYVTSFHRRHFTERCVREIHERTTPGSFELHLFDNDSMADRDDREFAYSLLEKRLVTSLHLDSRNTGCLYNKGVFHMMTTVDVPFYVVTDNDVFPPKLEPDWLSRMTSIMESHPRIGLLAMQLPPQWLQSPTGRFDEDVAYCEAVGNTYKFVRRDCFPIGKFRPALMAYGDDGYVSSEMTKRDMQVAFCRNIWCFHAGQTVNWGYRPEEVAKDPRKAGYGKPFEYAFEDELRYLPGKRWRILED
jgi:hypothetical protein